MFGWVSLFLNPLAVSSAIAIILGLSALKRSRQLQAEGGEAVGRQQATIGIVLGSIGAVVWAIAIVLFTLFLIEVDSRLS